MMKVIGNIESIKKSIEQRYQKELAEANKVIEQQIAEMKSQAEEKISLMRAKMKVNAEQDAKKEEAKIISEEKLKAKRAYEEKREGLINAVFEEAEKEKVKKAHTKAYIDFVKKQMPEGRLTAIADSDYYKKDIKAEKWEIDKSITGIKFVRDNMIFDFTMDAALNSYKERLRHVVSETLW